jgi:hypothetical protein
MSTETKIAKQAVHDTIDSKVKSVQAKLESLKAKAETGTAVAKAVADLYITKQLIDCLVTELKKSNETRYEHVKGDVESRIAELEQSVQAIEAKFKTA